MFASLSNSTAKQLKKKNRGIETERRESKIVSCSFQLCIMATVPRRALSPGTYEVTVPGGEQKSKNFIALLFRRSEIMLLYQPTTS